MPRSGSKDKNVLRNSERKRDREGRRYVSTQCQVVDNGGTHIQNKRVEYLVQSQLSHKRREIKVIVIATVNHMFRWLADEDSKPDAHGGATVRALDSNSFATTHSLFFTNEMVMNDNTK